jgi:hypothetical protein
MSRNRVQRGLRYIDKSDRGEYDRSQGLPRGKLDPLYRCGRESNFYRRYRGRDRSPDASGRVYVTDDRGSVK